MTHFEFAFKINICTYLKNMNGNIDLREYLLWKLGSQNLYSLGDDKLEMSYNFISTLVFKKINIMKER